MRTVKNNKTKIYFNGMNVPDSITDFKLQRKLSDYYEKVLFKELKSKLND